MALLKYSSALLYGLRRPMTWLGRIGRSLSQQSLHARLQAAYIVSVARVKAEHDSRVLPLELRTRKMPSPTPKQIQKNGRGNARDEIKTRVSLHAGISRAKEIELRLEQGQSFIDMELIFYMPAKLVAREADRLLGKHKVKELLRLNKRGHWSDYEVQRLMALREQRWPSATLTTWLRRTRYSVRKKLREIIPGLVVVEGPQELPPGLRESIFNTRLAAIWQALLSSNMAPSWREALQEKSSKEWLSAVSMGIPENVKKALGGLQPPTWNEIGSLPWIDTDDAGVYARLATSRQEVPMVCDHLLYVGSATKHGGLQNYRKAQQNEKRSCTYESRLQRDIKTMRLKGNGRFVTLMSMKMERCDEKSLLNVRRTVILTQAILGVWLKAFRHPPPGLQDACPWESETIQYTEWALRNPLLYDVVLPRNWKITDKSP